ncbi:glycosyltransferase family 4 protein [Nostoc sp. CHAB 5834]|nr:glycosyltransferase family 4 protein [Nostoc sp. CHAB 5834]
MAVTVGTMIKVAYLLGALDRGGTEVLLLDTLRQRCIDCVVVHRKSGTLQQAFNQTSTPLYHFPIRHFSVVSYLFRLRKLIRREQITILHAQLPFDAFLAYWACLGTGAQLVLTFHGYDIGYGKLARRMVRFISQHTSLNIYVSQHLRSYYEQTYKLTKGSAQQVVYNGIDFSKFEGKASLELRQELTIPAHVLLLGTVGNFVQGRDPLTICRALAALKEMDINFHFVFVGARNPADPDLYEACVAFCAKRGLQSTVHFLGSRTDVPAILPQLDAFVYASEHDTFGIAVVEAMAVGLPVFVNDWAVMREITREGQWATLYQTKSVDDLSLKLSEFVAQRTTDKHQVKQIALSVRNTYSIQKHVHALLNLYHTLEYPIA